ncbi:Predicted outer membrane protein [[Ruminococcus] torques]|nr:Predicted outer membrane protein [[Ruminococcus] torques]
MNLHLSKEDSETGKSAQGDATLEGAVYGLYAREVVTHPDGVSGVLYPKDAQVATLTTDADGNASVSDLYPGKYYVKEITPPEGYVLDEREHDVEGTYEGDQVKEIECTITVTEDVKEQPFQLIKAANNGKTDADLLKGAGFSAYLVSSLNTKEDGSYDFENAVPVVLTEDGKTEIFTDEKGYACTIPLPYGTYIVRETTTPHNFKPVDDFTVVISENKSEPQVWRVLLDDEFSAKLKIIKQDDETKKPVLLANTEFKIYDLDAGKYVEQTTTYPSTVTHKSYFTDENGYLILPNALKCGNYRIEEVTAPDGYIQNTNFVEIKVDSNTAYQMDSTTGDAIITVVYENHPAKGKLIIHKSGETLKSFKKDFIYEETSLSGAEFAVYAAEDIYTPDHQVDEAGNRTVIYPKDTLIQKVTTDEKGEAILNDLPLGTYRVVETKAPTGFVINSDSQELTFLYKDQNTPVVEETVEFSNKRQKVELKVVKEDAETGKKLEGAEFGIYNNNDIYSGDKVIVKADTLLQKVKSDKNGLAQITLDLPLGKYYVKELQAPDGYVSSDEILEFDASYQGQDVKVIKLKATKKNQPTTVEITKADVTTGVELDGASLIILNKKGEVVDSWTSVKDKPHVIKGLKVGEIYTLREQIAPYGYLRTTDISFQISDTAEVQKVKMEDDVPIARLLVNKKGEFIDDVTLLDNAKGVVEHFFSYVTGSLMDVSFNVYAAEDIKAADGVSENYYTKDQLVGTITTDGTGIAELDNLPLGKYYIIEKETSYGYVLDDEPRYVDLTYRDQDTPVVTYSADWQNRRQKVQVNVLKKEKDSEKVLSGAIFGLFAAEDIVSASGKILIEKDTIIELKTTDESGWIHFMADLPISAKYYLKEIYAPNGYVRGTETQEFTFEYQGDKTTQAVYEFTFEDVQTSVELSKADLTDGKELPGASLQVLDSNGTVVEEWISTDEPHLIRGLLVGETYTMVETKPADGYTTAESIEFKVEDTAEVQKHQMLDDVTKVEISKTDVTDSKEVPGAKLTILDKDGKVVESWVSKKDPHMVEKLPVGTYTLREEQAPDGYLVAEEVSFEVKDTGEIQKVEMKDARPVGKLVLKKTDAEDGSPLAGAEFELRIKKSGKVVATLVTDEEGVATSGDIPIASYKDGKMKKEIEYILVETKAPDGYVRSEKEESIVFTYQDDKTKEIEITKELTNERIPTGDYVKSPKTGDDTNIWLPILLLVLSVGGIAGIFWYTKKKNHEE